MTSQNASMDSKGVILLIIICASWGLNQVAIKVAIDGISPVLQAGIRSIGASVLVMSWMKLQKIPIFTNRDTTPKATHALWWGLLVGLLFSLEFILIYWGLKYTTASRSAIFVNTAPFAVALGAQIFIPGESLTRIQVFGLCLAFLGILAAFNESLNLPTRQMLLGDSMLLAAAVIWGATTVIIKASPLALIPPSKTLLYQLAVSAILLPPASLVLGEPGFIDLTVLVMGSMVYQTVWVAFITYVTWFWLIRKYPVSKIAPFTFLAPLFGVIFGAMLLGDPLTLFLIVALVLVGTGIYLVNRR